jgi:hypothetical protein
MKTIAERWGVAHSCRVLHNGPGICPPMMAPFQSADLVPAPNTHYGLFGPTYSVLNKLQQFPPSIFQRTMECMCLLTVDFFYIFGVLPHDWDNKSSWR